MTRNKERQHIFKIFTCCMKNNRNYEVVIKIASENMSVDHLRSTWKYTAILFNMNSNVAKSLTPPNDTISLFSLWYNHLRQHWCVQCCRWQNVWRGVGGHTSTHTHPRSQPPKWPICEHVWPATVDQCKFVRQWSMQESPVRAEARHHHPPTPSPPSRGNGVRVCVCACVCVCVYVWRRGRRVGKRHGKCKAGEGNWGWKKGKRGRGELTASEAHLTVVI